MGLRSAAHRDDEAVDSASQERTGWIRIRSNDFVKLVLGLAVGGAGTFGGMSYFGAAQAQGIHVPSSAPAPAPAPDPTLIPAAVSDLKTEVANLRGDVKADVTALRGDLAAVATGMQEGRREVAETRRIVDVHTRNQLHVCFLLSRLAKEKNPCMEP